MAQTRNAITAEPPAAAAGSNPLAAEFCAGIGRHADAVALREKRLGVWHQVTWAEYGRRAHAARIRIGHAGGRPGDPVLIVARPSIEWLSTFMGAVLAGAEIVILDESVDEADMAAALATITPNLAFTHSPALARTIAAALPGATVLMIDADGEGLGSEPDGRAGPPMDLMAAARGSDEVALVAFTAGTTRGCKAVRFTHANLLHAMEHGQHAADAGGERLAFASLARVHNLLPHVLAPLRHGGVTNFAEGPRTVGNDLRAVAPTVLTGSPRFWRGLRTTVDRAASRAVRPGRLLLRRAMAQPRPSLASRMLLSSVRRRFGLHRIRLAVVTGRLPDATILWFEQLGIHLTSHYAVTELCGVTLNADKMEPSASCEVRLGAADEILVRSPAVPADCVDAEGWFHSGDEGGTGRDGRIGVLGRMGADRTGSAPSACTLEREIAKSEYVVDCVVSRNCGVLSALVAVDEHVRSAVRSVRNGGDSENDTIIELLETNLSHLMREPGWLRRRASITIVHVDAPADDHRFTPCSRLRRDGLPRTADRPQPAYR